MLCPGRLLKISNNSNNNLLLKPNITLVLKYILLKILLNLKYHPNLFICNSKLNLPLYNHLPIKNIKIL